MPSNGNEKLEKLLEQLIDGVEETNQLLREGQGGGGQGAGGGAPGGGGGRARRGGGLGGRGGGGSPFGGADGLAGAALDSTVGFAVSATLKAGTKAIRQAAIVGASNSARLGGLASQGAINEDAALQGLATLPIVGSAAREVTGPRERALQRVKGQFASFARYGGKLEGPVKDLAMRQMDYFREQEVNAEQFFKELDALSIEDARNRDELSQGLSKVDESGRQALKAIGDMAMQINAPFAQQMFTNQIK